MRFEPPAPVSPGQRLFVAAWALLMVVVCFAPIWFAYAIAGEGWRFTGFHAVGLNDLQSYMAWIRQAQDGHLLFVDKFTTEPAGRLTFHPLFWLIGSLGRWTGAPIMAIWHSVQGLGIVLLVFSIHRFSSEFTDSPATRALALVLATTASGLGWLFPGAEAAPPAARPIDLWPVDLWMEEANAFRAICSSFFTLTLGLAFLLLACVWMLRYYRSGRLRDASIAGLFALALAAVHAYDVVTLYAVAGVWTLLAGRRHWAGMLVLVAISAPYMAYGFLVIKLDPVLSRVEFFMPVPSVGAHLIGWGLPLALAVTGLLLPAVWRDNRHVLLLLAWAAIVPLLLVTPLDFRRKLIWGVSVVFCLLAAMAVRALMDRLAERLGGARRVAAAAAVTVTVAAVALAGVGSVYFFSTQFEERRFGRFLPAGTVEAMAALDRLAEEDEVVLAGPALAGFLPGWTGTTVYWGHWAQTLDVTRKRGLARRMLTPDGTLDDEIVARELREHRIRFVVLDAASAELSPDKVWPVDPSRLPVAPYVRTVFRNEQVLVLEVR